MADLTPGETAAGIVGLVTSIGVSLAGALRWNTRMGKLEDSLEELQEKLDASQAEVKTLRSEVTELKAEVARVGRISLVDLKPTVSLIVSEEMRGHTDKLIEVREVVADLRGSIRGASPKRRSYGNE